MKHYGEFSVTNTVVAKNGGRNALAWRMISNET
jgi:hypothetical protein